MPLILRVVIALVYDGIDALINLFSTFLTPLLLLIPVVGVFLAGGMQVIGVVYAFAIGVPLAILLTRTPYSILLFVEGVAGGIPLAESLAGFMPMMTAIVFFDHFTHKGGG